MALRQSRRTVSLSRGVFEEAKRAAAIAQVPLSKFVEDTLRARMGGGAFDKVKAFQAEVQQLKGKGGIE